MSRIYPPFLEQAQKGKGCARMSEGAAQEYTMTVMLETMGTGAIPLTELRKEKILVVEIILKRINIFNLPITFTSEGLVAAYGLTENIAGRGVVLLIDCLTKWEGKTVNASMLADLYPFGFYNEETFTDYVDNYLQNPKTKNQIKWSEIY